ncbi:MAG: cob(I)yrinic acid a,c-diamide adenosyltransferase [Pseudomonadota bacterium]
MVVLNKIYTKTGDDGTTALGTGERRAKHDLRIEAYGTVDETNATIGLAREAVKAEWPDLDKILSRIQNDLFDLGADLATPDDPQNPPEFEPLRIVESQTVQLESSIDDLNSALEPLRSFVLPGGNQGSAALHLSRTVARRAERLISALNGVDGEHVNPHALKYMNRLSDFLFVAARWVNHKSDGDVLWVPGQNR